MSFPTFKYGPISADALAGALKHHGAEDIDIVRMAEELTVRRASDLTDSDREALAFAVNVLLASASLFDDRVSDAKIAEHVKQCTRAVAVLERLVKP